MVISFLLIGKKSRTASTFLCIAGVFFVGNHFLILPCVLAGCTENGIILDPFMGAGTTALVALQNNRNYIGFELNESYCNIAKKRIGGA